jgi:hypothetical protein
MHAKEVDAEHLYAALSAYMLAGIFFGLFYWVLEQIGPGTFAYTGDFSRMTALFQLRDAGSARLRRYRPSHGRGPGFCHR